MIVYQIDKEIEENSSELCQETREIEVFKKLSKACVYLNLVRENAFRYTVAVIEDLDSANRNQWEYIITIRGDEFLDDPIYQNYMRDI